MDKQLFVVRGTLKNFSRGQAEGSVWVSVRTGDLDSFSVFWTDRQNQKEEVFVVWTSVFFKVTPFSRLSLLALLRSLDHLFRNLILA